jgi:Asparagine synthase (glutamine-hydrolyzing)
MISEVVQHLIISAVVPNGEPSGTVQLDRRPVAGTARLFNRAFLLETLRRDGCPLPEDCSDETILLQLYALYGARGFALANGMFALVIVDGADLILVRDHVGTRSLFYTYGDGRWIASLSSASIARIPSSGTSQSECGSFVSDLCLFAG